MHYLTPKIWQMTFYPVILHQTITNQYLKLKSMKSGKMLLGLISGAAAGAALGLLFAPKKGADTRKAISDSSNEAIEGTKGKFNEFSDSLNHKVDALKNKTKASLSKAEQKANEAKAEIKNMKAS
ncbi:MAG TPA: YtxH domain-containing protein [Salegentibacter sp.]|nr:YtxH domain-containing protein [Salegentibacter sp.]